MHGLNAGQVTGLLDVSLVADSEAAIRASRLTQAEEAEQEQIRRGSLAWREGGPEVYELAHLVDFDHDLPRPRLGVGGQAAGGDGRLYSRLSLGDGEGRKLLASGR